MPAYQPSAKVTVDLEDILHLGGQSQVSNEIVF